MITGLSDHTMEATVPIVATTLGAKIIEKHFILDPSVGGPDASFSMTEREFTEMVRQVREAEKAIGVIDYNLTEKQRKGKQFARSLYIVKDVKKGDVLSEDNMRSIRPGFGLHPKFYNELLGKKVNQDLLKGTRMELHFVD